MLGGVRGALSIALAATITASAVISEADLHTINTMVFGVAFISIMVQVPLLFRYAKRKMPRWKPSRKRSLTTSLPDYPPTSKRCIG